MRVKDLVKRAPQAALLVAALAGWAACRPCDCPPFPDDTGDTGFTPDPDDGGRDRFRPGRMAVEGAFAFDPDTSRAVGWVDRDTPREVTIFVRMSTIGNTKHPKSPPQSPSDRNSAPARPRSGPLHPVRAPRRPDPTKTTVLADRSRCRHTSGSGERGLRRSAPPSRARAGALGLG